MPRIKMGFPAMLGLLIVIARSHGLLEIIAIFTALAIHEISHFLASHLLGYQVSEFKLTPLGGSLSLDPLFEINPWVEVVVAAAGPIANLMMAGGVLYLRLLGIHNLYLEQWLGLNLLITLVNLIPAFPLDGGRILHAGLNRMFGLEAAAVYSRRITLGIALFTLILGIARSISSVPSDTQATGYGISLISMGIFIGAKYFSIKIPNLELAWRFSQAKKKLLRKKGYLGLKPIIVDQDTPLRVPLRRYGTDDYLLFYVPLEGRGSDQLRSSRHFPDEVLLHINSSWFRMIGEEQAWEYLIAVGYQTTFREMLQNPLTPSDKISGPLGSQ